MSIFRRYQPSAQWHYDSASHRYHNSGPNGIHRPPFALRLEMRDGGINTYRFADVSKWRINGSDLEILRGDGSSEALFAVGDVKAVTYGEASDVSSIDMPQLSVSLSNGVLQIDGIGENSLVSVIAADGRSVLNAEASGSFLADMRGEAPGVYILTVDGKSVLKFVLR